MNAAWTATLLLATTAAGPPGQPEAQAVIERARDYFTRIDSIRLSAVEREVESGGLWAADPTGTAPVYKAGQPVREYDIWLEPPKQRIEFAERAPGAQGRLLRQSRSFYDGHTVTSLDGIKKRGLSVAGDALIRPMGEGPLHAVGYLFLDTRRSSLASLLGGGVPMTVERQPLGSRADWIIQVTGLPDDLQPFEWSPQAREKSIVRLWVSVEPVFRLHQWGVYVPRSGVPSNDALYGQPLPAFELAGHNLRYGFVNTDFRPARDELRGHRVQVPTRILHGNGNVTRESRLQSITINPRSSQNTFVATIPPGFRISKPGSAVGGQQSVSGDEEGAAVRVKEITQHAREILATGDSSMRAPAANYWVWALTALCALTVAGAALALRRKRRTTV
jgi:hypothetical protein